MMNKKAPPTEYFGSEVGVWWDTDKCPIPGGYDAWKVATCIKAELEKLGYSGLVTIFGLGNLKRIPEQVLQALLSTGIVLTTLPSRIRSASIVREMLVWFFKKKQQAPVSLMVITDSVGLDLLRRTLYSLQDGHGANILLAYPESLKGEYALVTHEQWIWKSLLKDAKSSGTGDFSCPVCSFVCHSFEEANEHLKGQTHALKELGVLMPWDPVDEKMMVEAGVDFPTGIENL